MNVRGYIRGYVGYGRHRGGMGGTGVWETQGGYGGKGTEVTSSVNCSSSIFCSICDISIVDRLLSYRNVACVMYTDNIINTH